MKYLPWIEYARTKIGTREIPGEKDNPYILSCLARVIHDPVIHDEIAWCSAFINDCMEGSGIHGTGLANARSWLEWGIELTEPTFGCVAIYSRPPNPLHGHVHFYMFDCELENCGLGGNQNNSVDLSFYSKSRVLGYRMPAGY